MISVFIVTSISATMFAAAAENSNNPHTDINCPNIVQESLSSQPEDNTDFSLYNSFYISTMDDLKTQVTAAADGIPVELICDGLHVHPAVVRGVFRVFGKKTCLISDSLRCAGMPDGRYSLGGQEFVLSDGCAALADGTLAGSAISLADAVRNAVSFGISPSDAFFAASYAPFASVFGDSAPFGLECGRAADLAVFDANLNLKAVFMDGERML